MKRIILILFFILFLLWTAISGAEERSIFVADLITLKISANGYTLEELQEKFAAFEIVESKFMGDTFLLTLRTFEPGEYRILLGDKELIIVVHSTLDELERDTIFTIDPNPLGSSYQPFWGYIFIAFIILLLPILILYTRAFISMKRVKTISPYEIFKKRLAEVEINSADFFVDLSFLFKEYLEKSFTCRLRGKTSREIIKELQEIALLEESIEKIREWFLQTDYYKYTGNHPDQASKERGREKLSQIVMDIEKSLQAGEG